MPERKILHPGDLFIWAVPNAGNPQKVQRYASRLGGGAAGRWPGCGAELCCPATACRSSAPTGSRQALTDTAELLEHDRGADARADERRACTLDRVLHEVEVPAHLREQPYLRPVYDHPQFIVRNVWRRYGGWYDGEPDNLLPAPRAEQAREWVALAGGVEKVLARARELAAAGDHRLACHLVEFAVLVRARRRPRPTRCEPDVYAARSAAAGVVDGPQHPASRRRSQQARQARPGR